MKPVSRRRWFVREPAPTLVQCLMQEVGLSQLSATLLVNRNITQPAVASQFISPRLTNVQDPYVLCGMERAIDRLASALKNQEKICVYGDYDVDGITSVALLVHFFREIGLDCFYHIPKRLDEGYGLSSAGVESVARQGAKVIITVDCGITAHQESHLCTSLGIDLIITDHHTPDATIPSACAVINPHLTGVSESFAHLAGVGVAFKLLVALRSRLREDGYFREAGEPDLREYLDLVALGTIADIVPLLNENRIYVKFGLDVLTNSKRIGIQALKAVAGITGQVSCGAVGFRLAPRLNAAGRLEDASLGVELLLCNDRRKAADIAARLDASNTERQAIEQEMLRDALSKVQGEKRFRTMKSIVLASRDWHPGVIGIVASRIVDMFHRPTILIALRDGYGRGSGRSIARFHLHDALQACSEQLLKFGGHKYAAGLSIDEAILETFVERFDEIAQGMLSDADLTPELSIDAQLSAADMTLDLAEQIEKLAPFGMGNPEPVFLTKGFMVVAQQVVKGDHLKLTLSSSGQSFEAIGFNMARGEAVPQRIDAVYVLAVNLWGGGRRLQLKLKDFRETVE